MRFARKIPKARIHTHKHIIFNTFKWINEPDAAVSQVYYLSFKYSSTCFGHPHAHHQELNNCSSSLWFYRWRVVVAVLLVVVGPAWPRPTAPLWPSSDGKPEAATAIVVAPDMGMRMPKTFWAVFKRQVINLRDCCIWFIDSFGSMIMHGLTNPKFNTYFFSTTTTVTRKLLIFTLYVHCLVKFSYRLVTFQKFPYVPLEICKIYIIIPFFEDNNFYLFYMFNVFS